MVPDLDDDEPPKTVREARPSSSVLPTRSPKTWSQGDDVVREGTTKIGFHDRAEGT